MKSKDYEKRRRNLKEEKRELRKTKFDDTISRKKAIDGINKSFRSLKRSEKQAVKKDMLNKAQNNIED